MDTRRTRRLFAGLVVASSLLTVAPALAQTTSMTFTYLWTPPTTGSPVHHYEVDVSANNGSTWTTVASPTAASSMISLAVGGTYVVRVRAVDAQSRPGPYSVNSDPNTPDPGAPSAPGKPARVP